AILADSRGLPVLAEWFLEGADMANFCAKCGGALDPGASFCKQCGAQVAAGEPGIPNLQPNQPPPMMNQPPAYAPPPVYGAPQAPLPPPTSGGSFFKFLLIAFFVIAALGVAGAVGVYYFAKSKVAELKDRTGVDLAAALESASKTRASRTSSEQRDGCQMLTKEEAERINGVPIARMDGSSRGG